MTLTSELAHAEHAIHIVLAETLELAVPLWVLELRDRTDEQRVSIAKRCAATVAERGDILMFGSKQAFKTAQAFNALAEGIAAAAYQPGGIDFLGRHWCIDHQRLCIEPLTEPASPVASHQRPVDDIPLPAPRPES